MDDSERNRHLFGKGGRAASYKLQLLYEQTITGRQLAVDTTETRDAITSATQR